MRVTLSFRRLDGKLRAGDKLQWRGRRRGGQSRWKREQGGHTGLGSQSAVILIKFTKTADVQSQILLRHPVGSSFSSPNTQEGPLEHQGVVREWSDNQPATFSPED